MISYTQLYTRCQAQSADSDATSLANFKLWLNDGIKKAYAVLNAERFYTSVTDLTAASACLSACADISIFIWFTSSAV